MNNLLARLVTFFILIIVTSCAKEFRNPYDPATPPDIWMPETFRLDTLGTNALRLSWIQEEQHIDGFVIQKNTNGQLKEILLPLDSLSYTDVQAVDTSLGEVCPDLFYKVMARAGSNRSLDIGTSSGINMPLPSPVNIDQWQLVIDANEIYIQLTASSPQEGETGEWAIKSGVGGSFTETNSSSTLFYGRLGESYVLSWSILNCSNKLSDTVSVFLPISFEGQGLTDIDGNSYNTQIIGQQEWMSSNLKTTRFSNGDIIPNIAQNTQWASLNNVAWSNYENSISNDDLYGKLYNWYVAADTRNVCPDGWHVPSETDWISLIDYLGGSQLAGGKMKATGISFWESPNTDASNVSGFSALPGGFRFNSGTFANLENLGYWWSASEQENGFGIFVSLYYNFGNVYLGQEYKQNGHSIRCIKN